MRELHSTSAVYLVDRDLQSVLLIRHKLFGAWFPVGGHIEPGETPHECAARELVEETGIPLRDVWFTALDDYSLSGTCPGTPAGYLHYGEYEESDGRLFQVHSFTAAMRAPDPAVTLDDGADAHEWVRLGDPDCWPPLRPHVRHILKTLRAALCSP